MLEGKRISDRYKVLSLIGGGGMSHVYLAHDMILDREVAMKVLRYDFKNEEELHRRFQREALSVTSLTHPNIVGIYDVGQDEDVHYIVMEYVDGQTLKEYIQQHSPIPVARVVEIMLSLTHAISQAHDNHIIHRDIKPQNVLMNKEGEVKVTDFGIAVTLNATAYTQTNSVLGTVHYLSPEQARGGMATKKSDIYALGVVMYELLTGELPFYGESPVAIALKHLQEETPSVRGKYSYIPQSVENVVLKATAKDPLHRYQSVEEMTQDLQTVLSPQRLHEQLFTLPLDDDDATKAMPIIKPVFPVQDATPTRRIEPVQPAVEEEDDDVVIAPPIKKAAVEPSPPSPEPPAKKKKSKSPMIIGILLGIMALLALLIFLLPSLMSPTKVSVPDVTALTLEEAIDELESQGFAVGDERERTSDTVDEGKIIETSPAAGKEIEQGGEIDLIVSIGKEKKSVSNYVGQNVDQVLSILKDRDYVDVVINEEYSDEKAGTVLSQSPVPGEQVVESETVLTLTVSQGSNTARVADLTGYNESALNEYARSSGFKINVTREEHSETIPAGDVMNQTPSANSSIEVGSTISVVMSKGPAEKPVKTFVQVISIPYSAEEQPVTEAPQQEEETPALDEEQDITDENESTEEELPVEEEPVEQPSETAEPIEQTIQIYIQDKNNTMSKPVEEFTITETTSHRIQLQIQEGTEAAYRVMRDNEVIIEEVISYDDL